MYVQVDKIKKTIKIDLGRNTDDKGDDMPNYTYTVKDCFCVRLEQLALDAAIELDRLAKKKDGEKEVILSHSDLLRQRLQAEVTMESPNLELQQAMRQVLVKMQKFSAEERSAPKLIDQILLVCGMLFLITDQPDFFAQKRPEILAEYCSFCSGLSGAICARKPSVLYS